MAFLNPARPNSNATGYYRTTAYVPTQPPRTLPDVRDDYERWYMENTHSNRMVLSLCSGIHSEVGWSLDRLCRLCHNEQFLLRSIPGLIDALFWWPEWYATEGYKVISNTSGLFSAPPDQAQQRRFALESLFVLRNAALLEQNALELAAHSHTLPLILNSFKNIDFLMDENSEFYLHIIELFHALAPRIVINDSTPPEENPLPPLQRVVSKSTNRTMIIAALSAMTIVLSNPANASNLFPTSPVLQAALRYLPLFVDKPLLEACLNYLYVHLSHPPMSKAFLLHPQMPNVLKVLVSLLIAEQVEEKVTVDITGKVHTVPADAAAVRDHDLTQEELDGLLEKPEPQRCYDWMKTMFVARPDGELTQVEFWTLYKDVFAPHQDKYPLLVASDVIKNVNLVFPQAQAMVLQDPVQRFIVRGVGRRKDPVITERFRCQWNRSQCEEAAFPSPSELYEHLLGHLQAVEGAEFPCLWSTCSKPAGPKAALRSHLLTHLSRSQPPEKHPSQSDTITLSSENSPYPTVTPTERPPPPASNVVISYNRPIVDPPSSSLTALLCIRILFRAAFASADAAPRVDADHFGFPGIVEEAEDQGADAMTGETVEQEKEGERRGRRAFVGVRYMMEGLRLKDEVLMSWVEEMVDAGIGGVH